MSSVLYKIVEGIVSILGVKKSYSITSSEIEYFVKERNGKQNFEPPLFIKLNFSVRCEMISKCPCWIIEPKNYADTTDKKQKTDYVLLFLHGGGFVFGIHTVHWLAVYKIVKRLKIQVWVPLYQLIPKADIKQMSYSIADVYQYMLKRIENKINIIGDSAGAYLSLVLCHLICCKKVSAPPPNKIILVSPGSLGDPNPEITAAMKETQKRDKLLSYDFVEALSSLYNVNDVTFKNLRDKFLKDNIKKSSNLAFKNFSFISQKTSNEENYIYNPFYGDFKRYVREYKFPLVYVFSGTNDIFFPQIPPFVERLKNAGIQCVFERGEGMMHIWPYMPIAPESAAAFEKIIKFIAV